MKILFNSQWTPEMAPPDADPERVAALLDFEKAAQRVDATIQRTFVWAKVDGLEGPKFLVRDVRILSEHYEIKKGLWVTSERLQVLLLEGWRTPERIWTDEESIEEVEGIQ